MPLERRRSHQRSSTLTITEWGACSNENSQQPSIKESLGGHSLIHCPVCTLTGIGRSAETRAVKTGNFAIGLNGVVFLPTGWEATSSSFTDLKSMLKTGVVPGAMTG